ncbi:MAG: O-acyltransferase [Acidimicrobiales bacterium]|nr:MAG: O-acyltransferase [Acidimicrobiales bacterium]
MTFNSFAYALFLPVVLVFHWLLPRRLRLPLLLAASYVFYAAWDWRFLGLLVVSTLTDFGVGMTLEKTRAERPRRMLLCLSVLVNLGILGTFKYFDFFAAEFSRLLGTFGLDAHPPTLDLVLPVGISFYTFQTLAYSIDVYRRKIPACRDPLLFATYVAFFPQLVAGPIERAGHLIPQLADRTRRPDFTRAVSAMGLILRGLFRKVVIADQMAPIVEAVFEGGTPPRMLSSLTALVAFSLQIYGDFAGYTDIARGSARLFGVELVENFWQPYLATGVTDFWRRWHVSLSTWLRDYLYIPLGGNRRGPTRTYTNLMATMLLGGLWHGASSTFLVWGGLHGLGLVAERASTGRLSRAAASGRLRRIASLALTFAFVTCAWSFFRGDSIGEATRVLAGLVTPGLGGVDGDQLALLAAASAATFGLDLAERRIVDPLSFLTRRPILAGALAGSTLLAILVAGATPPTRFIYFQF